MARPISAVPVMMTGSGSFLNLTRHTQRKKPARGATFRKPIPGPDGVALTFALNPLAYFQLTTSLRSSATDTDSAPIDPHLERVKGSPGVLRVQTITPRINAFVTHRRQQPAISFPPLHAPLLRCPRPRFLQAAAYFLPLASPRLATPHFAPRLHMGKPRACLRGLQSPPCPLSALLVGWQASLCPA